MVEKGKTMRYTKQVRTVFEGEPGTEITETVSEVFWWFYNGDGRDTDCCSVRHLNGITVTFEREK